jgi:hypothetical protein
MRTRSNVVSKSCVVGLQLAVWLTLQGCGTEEEEPDADAADDTSEDGSSAGDVDVPSDAVADVDAPCSDAECGPALGMPNELCADGSIGGPVCGRDASGVCAWTIRQCPEPALQWYATCGDPVCGPDGHRETDLPPCDGIALGDSCDDAARSCDPVDPCNVHWVCAASDPRQTEFGCPISRQAFKQQIDYLDDTERAVVAQDILGVRIATWQYRAAPERTHLGFILEDEPGSPAVHDARDQVDLYAYSTMILAAVQQQQAQIAALQAEVERLRAREAECAR